MAGQVVGDDPLPLWVRIQVRQPACRHFLPVIGPLDDVVVVALAFRYAARQVPRDVLLDAWPGDRRIIDRPLGSATTTNS